MNNIIKETYFYIKYALGALLILLSITSCNDDFLDTKPLGVATVGDLTTGGFEADAFGLYGQLRNSNVSNWTRYWFQSIRSDDAEKGSSAGDQAQGGSDFDDFNYSIGSGFNNNNWNDHYKIINACNDLIDAIEVSGLTDTGTLINMAEARMVRGFLYFELRRDYGEVPIVDKKNFKGVNYASNRNYGHKRSRTENRNRSIILFHSNINWGTQIRRWLSTS